MENLTNEEKIQIVKSHIKNLGYSRYAAELDLIQAQSVSNPIDEIISNIEIRISDIDAQLTALNEELSSLEGN